MFNRGLTSKLTSGFEFKTLSVKDFDMESAIGRYSKSWQKVPLQKYDKSIGPSNPLFQYDSHYRNGIFGNAYLLALDNPKR